MTAARCTTATRASTSRCTTCCTTWARRPSTRPTATTWCRASWTASTVRAKLPRCACPFGQHSGHPLMDVIDSPPPVCVAAPPPVRRPPGTVLTYGQTGSGKTFTMVGLATAISVPAHCPVPRSPCLRCCLDPAPLFGVRSVTRVTTCTGASHHVHWHTSSGRWRPARRWSLRSRSPTKRSTTSGTTVIGSETGAGIGIGAAALISVGSLVGRCMQYL